MLITLLVANSFKIANHLTDPDATYMSGLIVRSLTSKKGIVSDRLSFSLTTAAIDALEEELMYLCYDTSIKVYLDNKLFLNGYVTKVSSDAKDLVKFEVTSVLNYKLSQPMTPKLDTTCQNQVYSKNCGLDPLKHRIVASDVTVHCLTGYFKMAKSGDNLYIGERTNADILDGNLEYHDGNLEFIDPFGAGYTVINFTPIDGNENWYDGNLELVDAFAKPNKAFYDIDNWVGTILMLNGKYRSRVTRVENDRVYLFLNYLDKDIVIDTVEMYLACDKTYGICHKRFQNTPRFWGFPNVGKQVATLDIFSADDLTYCGSHEAELPEDTCGTDDNLFGVSI